MRRWLIPLVLATASRVASADPQAAPQAGSGSPTGEAAGPAAPDPAVTAALAAAAVGRTDDALKASTAADRQVGELTGRRQALAQRYEEQLGAVDKLKKQRASWRRDRELRASLADSLDTARQLDAITAQLTAAQQRQVVARRAVRAAIDGELAAGARGERATRLAALRAGAGGGPAARRIVIPDAEIDPLADPEELEQQAAALRESEAALAREVVGLDGQASELRQVAELRRQHERAGELAIREDDQPHRTAPSGGTRTTADKAGGANDLGTPTAPAPQNGGAGSTGTPTGLSGGTGATGFEAEATVVLADVVDASTIAALAKAQRSGDPAQRARAAQATRDAVAARLKALRERRATIEARAKALRGGR
jgi:hypothetical protein